MIRTILAGILVFALSNALQAQIDDGSVLIDGLRQKVTTGQPIRYNKDTSYYMLSKSEVLSLTNGIRRMQTKLAIYDTLTAKYKAQVDVYERLRKTDSTVIATYTDQNNLLRTNETLYKEVIEAMQPKWYDSKFLWAGIGFVVGVFVYRGISK